MTWRPSRPSEGLGPPGFDPSREEQTESIERTRSVPRPIYTGFPCDYRTREQAIADFAESKRLEFAQRGIHLPPTVTE